MHTTKRRHRRLQMRPDPVRRLAREKLGVTTDTEIARLLDVDRANMSRYLRGRIQPGPTVIAGLMDLLDEPFEVLFEVRPADPVPEPLAQAA